MFMRFDFIIIFIVSETQNKICSSNTLIWHRSSVLTFVFFPPVIQMILEDTLHSRKRKQKDGIKYPLNSNSLPLASPWQWPTLCGFISASHRHSLTAPHLLPGPGTSSLLPQGFFLDADTWKCILLNQACTACKCRVQRQHGANLWVW